jgi:hypothetical protein
VFSAESGLRGKSMTEPTVAGEALPAASPTEDRCGRAVSLTSAFVIMSDDIL